ncbi:hypothetical protein C8R45DRAFT_946733 [Mycena sanguinolenta]|nr:hypothetical protein C8R45DRAFT_946733 [Mycena sanguinolenta]
MTHKYPRRQHRCRQAHSLRPRGRAACGTKPRFVPLSALPSLITLTVDSAAKFAGFHGFNERRKMRCKSMHIVGVRCSVRRRQKKDVGMDHGVRGETLDGSLEEGAGAEEA